MNIEIENLIGEAFNRYLNQKIRDIKFRVNGKEGILLTECNIEGTPDIEISFIEGNVLKYSFRISSHYQAKEKLENGDTRSIYGIVGQASLSANGTATVKLNPSYKEDSHEYLRSHRYIVDEIEIDDNIVNISNMSLRA